jgi:colanic acid biosynthesis glycosyl transferase WcaI
MRIQLWSYNYDPEPTGIAPISTVWAQAMVRRGHEVEVVAAHPHYPQAMWGAPKLPYRENRDGIRVLRLPLWIGRASAAQRIRQELTYMLAHAAALPALRKPDVVVAVSPSFPALLPAMINRGLRRTPWVLWLQDILPDGAASTGLLPPGRLLDAARAFERGAYRSADKVVVISRSFEENLRSKGVPADKIARVYNIATRPIEARPSALDSSPPVVMNMGNIGFSQGLAPLVAAFERSDEMRRRNVSMVMAGDGVAADEVRSEIRSERVEVTGVLDNDSLEERLKRASLALVSQHYEGAEFNVPSKLMNFMAAGLPVIAVVRPDSEVARIVESAGAGWVVDSADPEAYPRAVVAAFDDPVEMQRRGEAATRFALGHFTPEGSAARFERVLEEATGIQRPSWPGTRGVAGNSHAGTETQVRGVDPLQTLLRSNR